MMTTTADPVSIPWSGSSPHVRKALAFIKARRTVTAEDLVAWDATHGRRLFDWDQPHAAEEWRRQQARAFMNRFRAQFENMRVKAFIHIRADIETGIDESAYVVIEDISQHEGMRQQVINDIIGRMKRLASELRLWRLSEAERTQVLRRLAEAMQD